MIRAQDASAGYAVGVLDCPSAMSWQDPRVLASTLADPAGGTLVVADPGDNALALSHAQVDLLPLTEAGRALAVSRRQAALLLPPQSSRSFLGLGHFGRRVWFYHFLRPHLPRDVQAFWDAREGDIRAGIVNLGRVEHAFAKIRGRGPLVWRLGLATLSRAPFRQRAGLGRGPEPGETSSRESLGDMVERAPDDSYLLAYLRSGTFPDPDAAHPWLGAANRPLAIAAATALTVLPVWAPRSRPPGAYAQVSLGDTAEHLSRTAWNALLTDITGSLRPGATVLAWERFLPISLPPAFREAPPHPSFPFDRSPLHARARVWRYEP